MVGERDLILKPGALNGTLCNKWGLSIQKSVVSIHKGYTRRVADARP